jgi:hypothetical protein
MFLLRNLRVLPVPNGNEAVCTAAIRSVSREDREDRGGTSKMEDWRWQIAGNLKTSNIEHPTLNAERQASRWELTAKSAKNTKGRRIRFNPLTLGLRRAGRETHSSKAPRSKRQQHVRNRKNQDPITRETRKIQITTSWVKRQNIEDWRLNILWSLVLGLWSF